MRFSILVIFSCACALISNRAPGQDAMVTLQYSDENAEERRYFITPAEDGSYVLAKKFVIAPDLDGYVTLRIKLKKPGFVYTSGLDRPLMVYVEPWKHTNVHIEETVFFTGDLRKENTVINSISGPPDIPAESMSTAAGFLESITALIRSDASAVRSHFQPDRRNAREFGLYLSRTRMLHLLSNADSLVVNKLESMRQAGLSDAQSKAWSEVRARLFADSLVNSDLVSSKAYGEYLMRYVNYLNNAHGSGVPEADSVKLIRNIQLANDYLKGPAKETYMSMFLSSNLIPGATFYGHQLIRYYEKFKKEFPKSAAITVLEPEMKRIAKLPLRPKN